MADTSILALDAVRLQRRLRLGKSLTFEKVVFWLGAQKLATRLRVVALSEVANSNQAAIVEVERVEELVLSAIQSTHHDDSLPVVRCLPGYPTLRIYGDFFNRIRP